MIWTWQSQLPSGMSGNGAARRRVGDSGDRASASPAAIVRRVGIVVYSRVTMSLRDAASSVATTRTADMASSPLSNEPVSCRNSPIM